MAKKKSNSRRAETSSDDGRGAVEDDPRVQKASATLRRAQEELRRAEEQYRAVREQAAEKFDELRETTVGDLIDGTLDVVRKHPGPSLLVAVAVGFMLDRLLRR